jgi:segregation and condensation protein B
MDKEFNLKDVIYSILFVAGDGVEKGFLAEKLGVSEKNIEKAIAELEKELSGDCGVHLIRYKNKVQLSSNPNYASVISDVLNPIREKALTRASLETLAIIAYKQPITKLEVEDVRRVNSDYAVQILLDQDMIEVVGRKDAVGKPLLFGTTENFLKRFNIENLSDLPDYEELMERIKTLRQEEDEEKRDTLFRDVQDLEFNEELPDFLKGENVEMIEGEKALEEKLSSLVPDDSDAEVS